MEGPRGLFRHAMSWTGTFACVTSLAILALSWGYVECQRVFGVPPESAGSGQPRQDAEADIGSSADNHSQFHHVSEAADTGRFLIVLSTMDGYVTALNGVTGAKEWSVSTGTTPLLSSSISKLEVKRGNQMARLIPSLDGGLYQFDGESIEPIPLAADILLSSSFRFSDDSTVVGAKEIETYGIDLQTGKVRYMCSSAGCKYFSSGSERMEADGGRLDETLIVTRSTKTIRTVEMHSGMEKWNFSVAQHDLTYVSRLPKPPSHDTNPVSTVPPNAGGSCPSRTAADSVMDVTSVFNDGAASGSSSWTEPITDDVSDQCNVENELDESEADELVSGSVWSQPVVESSFDLDLKVVVPSGLVVAMDRSSRGQQVYWQHKCSSAVAAAWILRNQQLTAVSLFDDRNVPALQQDADETVAGNDYEPDDPAFGEPLMYIGIFQDQLYVQPSIRMMQEVDAASNAAVVHGSINMPRVRWLPYLATATSRTPAASVPKNYPQIGYDKNPSSTAVVQWHGQYPFDGGYYLYPEFSSVEQQMKLLPLNSTDEQEDDDLTVSLLNWWKEVLGISVLMSAVVNVVVFRCMNRRNAAISRSSSTNVMSTSSSSVDQLAAATETTSLESEKKSDDDQSLNTKPPEYVSRYLADFQQEMCLGRGGFGVVFRARNQLDDCVYAVKRIALHDSDRAREKVTREVKALAKLDHPGIVRYYQSWFECPPPGWQEERDRLSIDLSLTSPSAGMSPIDDGSSSRPRIILSHSRSSIRNDIVKLQQHTKHRNGYNPLKPFTSGFNESSSSFEDHATGIAEVTENNESVIDIESSSDLSNTRSSRQNQRRLSADSGTENDDSSFEISFRDESHVTQSDSSEGDCDGGGGDDGRHGDNANHCGNPAASESSSFSIVFEDNADTKPPATVAGQPGATDNFPVDASVSRRRPQTLDLSSKVSDGQHDGKKATAPVQKLYLYIQMQLCQQESLKDWLGSNTLNRDKCQLLDVFHQIVSAIGYVHECGLMHRDLKPSNIFFAMDGSVKIGDFGLVTAVEENCSECGYATGVAMSPDAGRHTNQVGTRLYMSPEQCAGRNYTHKVDIYALGMIFFELFYPFATEMERTKTLLDVRILRFPQRFLRELSEEARFVRPLLSHDPHARPSTKQILQDPIVMDFEEASQAYRRLHSQCRGRTVSNSSGNSVTGGENPPSCVVSAH